MHLCNRIYYYHNLYTSKVVSRQFIRTLTIYQEKAAKPQLNYSKILSSETKSNEDKKSQNTNAFYEMKTNLEHNLPNLFEKSWFPIINHLGLYSRNCELLYYKDNTKPHLHTVGRMNIWLRSALFRMYFILRYPTRSIKISQFDSDLDDMYFDITFSIQGYKIRVCDEEKHEKLRKDGTWYDYRLQLFVQSNSESKYPEFTRVILSQISIPPRKSLKILDKIHNRVKLSLPAVNSSEKNNLQS